MIDNIVWLGHSSIKIIRDKIIYIDPYNLTKSYNDADIIFITHSHYDHYSKEDIKKCMNKDTKIIVTSDIKDDVLALGLKEVIDVEPNNEYIADNISFNTIRAYNPNKSFHPKENNWVGYIININGIKYYIAGDTDITDENKRVKCDVAFLPVGGKYTMDAYEASELANIIKPKIVIPIHYGTIIGSEEDAITFKNNVDSNIECIIL